MLACPLALTSPEKPLPQPHLNEHLPPCMHCSLLDSMTAASARFPACMLMRQARPSFA